MARILVLRLAVVAAVWCSHAFAQKVVEFPHSGIHHPLRLSPSDIVVRVARSNEAAERALIASALPQSASLQRMDQDYLVRLPGTPDLRAVTGRNSPARQPGIIDLFPVFERVVQTGPKGSTPRPPVDPRAQTFEPLIVLTKEVLVELSNPADASAIATATGALSSRSANAANWWIFVYGEPMQALDAAEWVLQNRRLPVTPMFGQFHFPRRAPIDRDPRDRDPRKEGVR
jgi:hypothetical protein